MAFFAKVFDISKINSSSTDEGPRGKVLCSEHHSFDKGRFKAILQTFSDSIKLGLRGNPGSKETVSIFQNEDISRDRTLEELELRPICIAFSWFIFGLVIACLLLCITLVLTSRYPGKNEECDAETVPPNIIDDEEKQLLSSVVP